MFQHQSPQSDHQSNLVTYYLSPSYQALPTTLYLPGVLKSSHKNTPMNFSPSTLTVFPRPTLSLPAKAQLCLGPRPSSISPVNLPYPPLPMILLPFSDKNDAYHHITYNVHCIFFLIFYLSVYIIDCSSDLYSSLYFYYMALWVNLLAGHTA